jgi:asparagine synthase (glutamine-hydrolysing)
MCGIAGFINNNIIYNYNNKTILENMINKLEHRGPDEKGFYIKNKICFGHKRLIVIDPIGGKQPMMLRENDKDIVIIYNGELYNTNEVRNKLIKQGQRFISYSDTEVILKSYICWNKNCLEHLDGIFAFAIYDERSKKIFMARDRFGVKPLFFYLNNNSFAFASEIKSIFEFNDIKAIVDKEGLQELFALGPMHTPGKTVFKDIYELKPGCFLELDINNFKIKQERYFKLYYKEHKENIQETSDHIFFLLNNAIKKQLVSDIPVGTFLSGGVDSSIISAIAAKEKKFLNTFSLSFTDNDKYFDEFANKKFQLSLDDVWVKKVADYIKSSHKNIIIDSNTMAYALERAMIARDMPGMADIDSSLMLFCKEIKKHVTVALSGECADEIFGGYPWFYRESMQNNNNFPWLNNIKVRESVFKMDLDLEKYSQVKYQEAINDAPYFPKDINDKHERYIRNLFYINIVYFMNNMLERKDRMSMASSLEVRVPFCDHKLVEYVFNIPWKIKFYNNIEKYILRLSCDKKLLIPQEVLWRKKNPYPKTFDPNYTSLIIKMLSDELINSPLLEIINKQKLFDLIDNKTPWYGQLMSGPQLAGYFYQVSRWMRHYKINLFV